MNGYIVKQADFRYNLFSAYLVDKDQIQATELKSEHKPGAVRPVSLQNRPGSHDIQSSADAPPVKSRYVPKPHGTMYDVPCGQ